MVHRSGSGSLAWFQSQRPHFRMQEWQYRHEMVQGRAGSCVFQLSQRQRSLDCIVLIGDLFRAYLKSTDFYSQG